MITNKLEKKIVLYKNQFEKLMMDMNGSYLLDRTSMDLDAILFRIKYMTKHEKDLDKLLELRKKFTTKALELRDIFGEFMLTFLCQIITVPYPFKLDDIEDVLAQDVKIDGTYVTFDMILISSNEEYLKYVDEKISEDGVFNMFPNEYFRFFNDSYNDGIAKAYPELFENRQQDKVGSGSDKDVFCHNFTFQVTEGCTLNCTYCYQFNKKPTRMSFEVAKSFIDHLLHDDYGYINRYNSPAIIIEFIGGEPLMEVKLIRKIYEYFLDQCYELNHPWFTLHRLSICSNGMQYFDDDVQEFFKDYANNISFNISIDGNKELHDSCRIQPNGEGSYDVDMVALNHYNRNYTPERNSKMTLAPENISHLFESVVDFINHDMTSINLNCVFEEGWQPKHALIEYQELKKLADYILENNLEHLYISIFNERPEDRSPKTSDGNFCGGTGSMLSMRPNGQFYPCIRYMPSSVGDNVKDLCIGTVQDGMIGREEDSEILKMMDSITRRSQTNDICYECPIGNDCAWCSALGHTVFGTPNKRPTFTCIMMIAEAVANVYFWNMLNIKHPEYNLGVRENVVPDQWSLLVIDKDELNFLKKIEAYSMIITMENQ
ncbi:MAG: radical SAM peptide maturase, CXXX-repeat target family [Lachnospiraceae bacterium]|nr:radical SAM peptide maturase, CXXX-repeat target family [Lachnospiraceae bacterium]MCM1230721.1 radical SAM peptide maturase, CXXX-repeat target family [Ruminococcus flavefaciens]